MEKRRHASNVFAKECISTALLQLMESNKYEDITITDITKKAGVSRVTYYRNFANKEAIIISYLDDLFYQYQQETQHLPEEDDYQFLLYAFYFFEKYSDIMSRLYEANLATLVLDCFNKYVLWCIDESEERLLKYAPHYQSGAIFNVFIEWIKSGKKESVEDMAALVQQLNNMSFKKTSITIPNTTHL
ncbi:TetR/AcrR family transcriptional regulator [Salipaludibacillus agaradhaerens]|uniref:TetR/AcrR family transcriptional regulator n=1 Tax=Salipaludibacillus agaradhaerens TaxID=76935 RepID=UPI0009963507|nr:TetR/AcrR family transcriptional regulator [Salipaludibacillus agaradhaerens]